MVGILKRYSINTHLFLKNFESKTQHNTELLLREVEVDDTVQLVVVPLACPPDNGGSLQQVAPHIFMLDKGSSSRDSCRRAARAAAAADAAATEAARAAAKEAASEAAAADTKMS